MMNKRFLRTRFTRWPSAVMFLLLAATAGCVRETSDGSGEAFQYELWAPLAMLVAGAAAAPAGWFLRSRSTRLGWGLLVLGPVFALALAPSLYLERTTVDDGGFHIRSGIWGSTAVFDLNFSDIRSIRFTSETRATRRGQRTEHFMMCALASGGETKIPVNNDVKRAAVRAIVRRASEHGISVAGGP
ncbi:MAG TPA: hypothetical protein VFW87_26975 [Pirellulales bacterium]|nr:hypothetical protein [Pirellulales bacterium]